MMTLTPRQHEALRFIAGFKESLGIAPTLREIADGLGLHAKSVFTADWLVRSLEERGAIRTAAGLGRSIEVLVPVTIPRAPDGDPLRFVPIGGAA
jgi:SOS-response transcriptional repressor LexA